MWKQCETKETKYQFLINTGASELNKLFRTEINSSLLSEFIKVLNENYTGDNSKEVLLILDGFSKVQRFSLSIDFMSNAEKDVCTQLFRKLTESFNADADTVEHAQMQSQLSDVVKHYLSNLKS